MLDRNKLSVHTIHSTREAAVAHLGTGTWAEFRFFWSLNTEKHGNIEHRWYLGPMGQDYDHAAVILRMIHLRQSWQLVFNLLKSEVCLLAWHGVFKGIYCMLLQKVKEETVLTLCFRFILTFTIKFSALNLLSSLSQSTLEPLRLFRSLLSSNSTLFIIRQCPEGLASIL